MYFDGVSQIDKPSAYMVERLSSKLRCVGKSARLYGELWAKASAEVGCVKLSGKTSKLYTSKSVPQTDTGGQVENTKANERTELEEFGKITP